MTALQLTPLRLAAPILLGAILTGCAKPPTSVPMAQRLSRPAAAAPVVAPVAAALPTAVATPVPTGTVALALSALQAEGIRGLGIELTGAGLSSPIGKVLTPQDLSTSNTLVFEHLPAGALTARVVALGDADRPLAEVAAPITVSAGEEARVALLLTPTPEAAPGGAPVNLRFVAPEVLEAPAVAVAPAPAQQPDVAPAPRPVSPASRALSLALVDQQVIRKFLLLKRLQVTVRVTNDNPTETLTGEVKVQFQKLKGLLSKTDTVVETLTAPVESLAPGRSVELTLTSTVSAEDAKATVHTVVASSSASTRDEE
ncbi:MAG: hypothetical protein VKQ33_00625 [Candidatus Sericytochromatia bacterium]|nr:hypothetical protein [Candidatus Sericytochromatia bacterium]